ncbi:hypothetical protein [Candidatus Hodgkinia cicadicola]|uniref:hypothetical protein n=1 Tax=Candidatus Hodgkinia cicadicola TaxID=573658 RepID=UPI0011BA587B
MLITNPIVCSLSGLESIKINRDGFYEIGEQVNVSKSSGIQTFMITSGNSNKVLDVVKPTSGV